MATAQDNSTLYPVKMFSIAAWALVGIAVGVAALLLPSEKMVLALAVGAILTIFIFLWTEVGVILIFATLPLEMLTALSDPQGVSTVTVPKIIGLLTAASWVFNLFYRKRRPVFPKKILIMILFYSTIILADLHAWVAYPDMILDQTKQLLQIGTIVGLCVLLTNSINTEKQLVRVVDVWIASGTFIAMFSIYQRFFTSAVSFSASIEKKFGGLKAFVDPTDLGVGEMIRTVGVSTDPSWSGLTAVMMIPLLLYKVWTAKSAHGRYFFGVLILLQLSALVFSYSRSNFITFIVVMLVVVLKRRVSMQAVIIVLLLGVASIPLLPQNYINRITNLTSYKESGTSKFRADIMTSGLKMFRDHPLVGVGLGNFDKHIFTYSVKARDAGEDAYYGAHNVYIQIASETGILGISVFLLLLGSIWRSQRRMQAFFKRTGNARMFALLQAFELSFIAFMFFGIFAHDHLRKEWWLIAALTIVAEGIAIRQGTQKAGALAPGPENPEALTGK